MTEWCSSDVERELLRALATRLATHGYAGPKGQSFHRPIPGGRTSFHVAFIRHIADLDVTADVAIRIDALQDLLHRQDPKVSKSQSRETSSIGAELGNIAGTGQKRWTVRSGAEVASVADAIVREFELVGLPYLDKHAELENMLAAVSRNDRSGWLHSPIHLTRCKCAVGLAHLLGRSELVDELIRTSAEYLRSQNDWGLPAFLRFADWIRDVRSHTRSS